MKKDDQQCIKKTDYLNFKKNCQYKKITHIINACTKDINANFH